MKFCNEELIMREAQEQEEKTPQYKRIEDMFDYLGELKTTTEIYKDNYKTEEKQEERLDNHEDIQAEDLEDIVRLKKLSDMGHNTTETINPNVQEKWAWAKLFAQTQVKAMLNYQLMFT